MSFSINTVTVIGTHFCVSSAISLSWRNCSPRFSREIFAPRWSTGPNASPLLSSFSRLKKYRRFVYTSMSFEGINNSSGIQHAQQFHFRELSCAVVNYIRQRYWTLSLVVRFLVSRDCIIASTSGVNGPMKNWTHSDGIQYPRRTVHLQFFNTGVKFTFFLSVEFSPLLPEVMKTQWIERVNSSF